MAHFYRGPHKMRSIRFWLMIVSAISLIDLYRCQKINSHLRVASFYNPLGNLPNETVNKMGMMESQLIAIISQNLNFTYEIHVPTDVLELGSPDEKKKNGSWTGVFGQLVRDEVDMSISFGPLFYSRYSTVDVTVTIILDDISIMVPYPKAINSAGSYLTGAFSPMTQVFLYGSFGVVPIALWIVALVKKQGERDLGVIFIFVASVALGQGGYLREYGHYSFRDSFAIRLIHGSWLMALLVITYAFSGVLISLITTPKFDFIARSIEDVAANEDIQPLIVYESSTQAEFEDSTNPIFQAIFKRIKENPNQLLVPSSSEFVDLLLSAPDQVLIMSRMLADSEIQEDYRKNKVCRATLLPKVVKSTANSLYLRKDSQYTLAMNRELLLLRQAGLSEYLDNTFGQYSSRCYIDQSSMGGGRKQNGPPSPLSLYNLRGVFYTIGYLLLICFVVFLCELLLNCYQNM